MLHIPRIVLVAVFCVLALACGNKEQDNKQPEETPTTAPPANEGAPPPAANEGAEGEAGEGEAAEGEAAEEPSGLVPQLEKLAEKACGCKDKACAAAVQDEVATLMAEAKQPPQSETQTIANTMQKLQGCVAAAQQK